MKISLVIPTRNRANYLRESLKTALAINSRDVEVVVTDNASSDDTEAVVNEFSDTRLKYFRTKERVSMRANFENGLQKSSGDYVSFIGDDDGYIPNQFGYLTMILEQEKPDNVTWLPVPYSWPEARKRSSKLKIRRRNLFGLPIEIDNERQRSDLFTGKLSPQGAAPAIYHGIASREFIDQIRSKSGVCFNGNVPDIYFGYRAIMRGGTFLQVSHPFSVPGRSKASTGASQFSSSNLRTTDSPADAFARENQSDTLRDMLDHGVTLQTALFSTLVTAVERFPQNSQNLDYCQWYANVLGSCKNLSPSEKELTKAILSQHATEKGFLDLLGAAENTKPIKRPLRQRISTEISNIWSIDVDPTLNGIDDIVTATNALDSVLDDAYKDVLQRRKSRAAAWYEAKKRA